MGDRRYERAERNDMNPDTSSKTGTILVVDDETAVTGSIEAVLSKEGYQVHLAHNGTEGVNLASQVKPDLIIMDITMPGRDGYEATERLKQIPALKDVPIIFLTGKSASEDDGMAFAKGGTRLSASRFPVNSCGTWWPWPCSPWANEANSGKVACHLGR